MIMYKIHNYEFMGLYGLIQLANGWVGIVA